ncbi:hypothetical protein KC644_00665 [Candidatus Berkelbacteria bacterium]|nr:hypothetical protein [Candidatus Berkelbacteria bacterium]
MKKSCIKCGDVWSKQYFKDGLCAQCRVTRKKQQGQPIIHLRSQQLDGQFSLSFCGRPLPDKRFSGEGVTCLNCLKAKSKGDPE